MGVAIIGPLVLAAIMAGVMTWLSRQVSPGAPAAPELGPAAAKAWSQRPPVTKPAPPALTPPASVTPIEPQATAPEVEAFVTEAAGLEREETHRRLVPTWLVVVYVVVIVWALVYIFMEVVPFFKPLTPQAQSAPAVALTSTVAPAAPQSRAYSGKGNPANGEELFTSQGCSACHSLKEGERIVGPSLYRVGQTAADRIKGTDYRGKAKTAEEYIRESIVEPNVYIVPGFPAGVMPQDFGRKLGAQDIDDLIAFLMTK
jgi:nitric oxide reductase subunit C